MPYTEQKIGIFFWMESHGHLGPDSGIRYETPVVRADGPNCRNR